MQLDNRLRSVVNEIVDSQCVIDVGTDHGKVILTALEESRTQKGIASDISSDSLSKATELAQKCGIALDTRVGDGLSVLSDDDQVDTAVIAGMGGNEIVKILSAFNGKIPRLILVPHRDAKLTRSYLNRNGYRLDKDYIIKEGKFYYNIIVATIGKEQLDDIALYLGKNSLDNEIFREYLEYRTRVLEEILRHTTSDDIKREFDAIKSIR